MLGAKESVYWKGEMKKDEKNYVLLHIFSFISLYFNLYFCVNIGSFNFFQSVKQINYMVE